MAEEDHRLSAEVLQQVIAALSKAEPTSRSKILQTAATFFDIRPTVTSSPLPPPQQSEPSGDFSEDRSISPKDFIHDTAPQPDPERVTCLAYYLTHYRATPHFKTLDISKLNTEAAQVKFSNAAWSVENAAKKGLLVPAPRGHKQISSFGERFVLALPNRNTAKEVLANIRKKRRTKRADDSNNSEISTEESTEDSLI